MRRGCSNALKTCSPPLCCCVVAVCACLCMPCRACSLSVCSLLPGAHCTPALLLGTISRSGRRAVCALPGLFLLTIYAAIVWASKAAITVLLLLVGFCFLPPGDVRRPVVSAAMSEQCWSSQPTGSVCLRSCGPPTGVLSCGGCGGGTLAAAWCVLGRRSCLGAVPKSCPGRSTPRTSLAGCFFGNQFSHSQPAC